MDFVLEVYLQQVITVGSLSDPYRLPDFLSLEFLL
jgi:hypothetical protein